MYTMFAYKNKPLHIVHYLKTITMPNSNCVMTNGKSKEGKNGLFCGYLLAFTCGSFN